MDWKLIKRKPESSSAGNRCSVCDTLRICFSHSSLVICWFYSQPHPWNKNWDCKQVGDETTNCNPRESIKLSSQSTAGVRRVPFYQHWPSASSSCGKMLSQNHFAEPNQPAMFWLFFIIQFSFAEPHIQHWWSCSDEAMCWAFLSKNCDVHKQSYPQEALAKFGYRSKRKVEILQNPALLWQPAGTYCLHMVIS